MRAKNHLICSCEWTELLRESAVARTRLINAEFANAAAKEI